MNRVFHFKKRKINFVIVTLSQMFCFCLFFLFIKLFVQRAEYSFFESSYFFGPMFLYYLFAEFQRWYAVPCAIKVVSTKT